MGVNNQLITLTLMYMKKLILFLFVSLSTSLFCFGQSKSALKDIQSIKFYGVDYSQVKIFGAAPIAFHQLILYL